MPRRRQGLRRLQVRRLGGRPRQRLRRRAARALRCGGTHGGASHRQRVHGQARGRRGRHRGRQQRLSPRLQGRRRLRRGEKQRRRGRADRGRRFRGVAPRELQGQLRDPHDEVRERHVDPDRGHRQRYRDDVRQEHHAIGALRNVTEADVHQRRRQSLSRRDVRNGRVGRRQHRRRVQSGRRAHRQERARARRGGHAARGGGVDGRRRPRARDLRRQRVGAPSSRCPRTR